MRQTPPPQLWAPQECLPDGWTREDLILNAPDFVLDCALVLGGDVEEFDADPHALQAIPNFGAESDVPARPRQDELHFYDRALRKVVWNVHKHPARADVGRADHELFAPSFVHDRQVAIGGIPLE